MAVRGVGRGGKTGGASGAGGSAKASGNFRAKVDRAQATAGASGTASAAPVGSVDPVVAKAQELLRQLKAGELASRDEATRKLVGHILKEKVRTQSKPLSDWIVQQLEHDPANQRLLEQLWKRASEES